MESVVSVLCARVKVEEKWLIEALAEAGIPARPFPPTSTPLPIGPVPTGPLATSVVGGVVAELSGVVIDRCADRILAGAIVPTLRALGTLVIDGGLAATGNRLTVASALASAGIPRPATLLVTSEDAGMAVVRELGYPVTLLPLDSGSAEIPLSDRDIAEAVLEHREVLGDSLNRVSLIQAGTRASMKVVVALVLGGCVVAYSQHGAGIEIRELAQAAATALKSSILGVTIAVTADGPVVWDVQAVPQFRDMLAADHQAIATAFLEMIDSRRTQVATQESPVPHYGWNGDLRAEVTGDVVLSA